MISGLLMFAVHFFGGWMTSNEYGLFVTLLQTLNLIMIPALGLQTVFAQQTALAKTSIEQSNLSISIRKILLSCIVVWVFAILILTWIQAPILSVFKINNPLVFYLTIIIGLPQLCLPILLGILQGQQNFRWLGGASIINGLIRFLTIGIMVAVLGTQSTGAIFGVLIGLTASCIIAAWHSRDIWAKRKAKAANFNPNYWLRRIVPLTFGLGAGQFMLSADMLAARSILPEGDSGPYGAAGMIGRGLVIFTAPLAAVMFPKIASSRDSLKLGILKYTTTRTAALSILVCIICSLTAWLLPSITEHITALSQRQKIIKEITALIPYFIWSMLPLALANVYIAALLAKEKYKGIPLLITIALSYALALIWLSNKPDIANNETIILTLGAFNLAYLAAAKYLTKQLKNSHHQPIAAPES
ncbi:MAG: hypothetical protein VYC62_00745 [Verrucomicrobiota bacterium]|nr:hypothetical protein [Verrucomicrobiota bacterium]